MVNYVQMGKRMRMKRRSKKLSQEDLAKAVQISTSFYGNIERGISIPSIDTLVAIANVLEADTDFLLCDSVQAANPQHTPEEMRLLARYLQDRVAELKYEETMDEEALSADEPIEKAFRV